MPKNPLPLRGFIRMRQLALSISLSLLLVACNGDGGDSAPTPTPAPTELPFSVEVQGPAANNALGTAVSFSASVADPSNKLKYQWQFGDGESSTQANPTHNYAKAGVYRVQLIITNEVGATRASTADVSVSDSSITNGKQCSGDNNGGWCWQRPLPNGYMLNDYTFVDQKHGWAVGEMGSILSTSDGGLSWQQQDSGTKLWLSKVVFTSLQDGWALSRDGVILKTSNGGASWDQLGYKQGIQVQSFNASDANTAWVQNESINRVLITHDGGTSWTSMVPPSSDFVTRYLPLNASVVWALEGHTTPPSLHRTLNGGVSWEAIPLPALASGWARNIDNLVVVSANEVWLTGTDSGSQNGAYVNNKFAIKTRDGGQTWQTFTPYPNGMQFLQFGTANVVYAFASAFPVELLRSTDGGATWEHLSIPDEGSLPGLPDQYLKVLPDTRLLLRQHSGRTYISNDRGASWQEQTIGSRALGYFVSGLWFFDSREGIATLADGSISHTSDGGQSWVTSTSAISPYVWGRPQFLANGTGWLLSDSGIIYRSTDKGKTWVALLSRVSTNLYGVVDFHFIDANNGWAVKSVPSEENGKRASIFRTTDGGTSWSPIDGTGDYLGLNSIRFTDANVGVAVGRGGLVLVTTNGGVSWSARSSGFESGLGRVAFIDSNTVVAIGGGGTIIRSSDRGQTWKWVPGAGGIGLTDVQFISSKLGWAVGQQGTVLITRDGGLSWSAQSSLSSTSFNSVFFVNEQTGWIGGSGGTIMATTTGGR